MTQVQPEEDISHDVTANKNWQRIDNPSDKRWSGVVLVVVLLSEPALSLNQAPHSQPLPSRNCLSISPLTE